MTAKLKRTFWHQSSSFLWVTADAKAKGSFPVHRRSQLSEIFHCAPGVIVLKWHHIARYSVIAAVITVMQVKRLKYDLKSKNVKMKQF